MNLVKAIFAALTIGWIVTRPHPSTMEEEQVVSRLLPGSVFARQDRQPDARLKSHFGQLCMGICKFALPYQVHGLQPGPALARIVRHIDDLVLDEASCRNPPGFVRDRFSERSPVRPWVTASQPATARSATGLLGEHLKQSIFNGCLRVAVPHLFRVTCMLS
ncbi:uncharacterized protein BDZ83DRAFT_647054 [Colletotrichum acutatum]|uniref:Secreted protein n=1 Tax=Glomerella acutata TaxID=27357 RepID=A0AAD9D0Z8_GLOAC|nr:uncharacterized protein BDZ83DRAFT_647054 [Colletotrichum acutatum]KAK1730283.1 hypothetical protein BDZ83DRAFT_647054 [Colletotrichum acutatum]